MIGRPPFAAAPALWRMGAALLKIC
jgi:hypothetical protein